MTLAMIARRRSREQAKTRTMRGPAFPLTVPSPRLTLESSLIFACLAPESGVPMYTHGFLPSAYQPTMFRPGPKPVPNLDLPAGVSLAERRKTLDLLRSLNLANLGDENPEFAARMSASIETAANFSPTASADSALSHSPP